MRAWEAIGRALAGALLLVAGLLAFPSASPSRVVAVGPLPDCSLEDFLTVPRDYDDWSTTLVDWLLGVGKDYKPPDLVPISEAGVPGGGSIRKVAIKDLRALAKAAAANGTPLGNISAYRSYRQQVRLFDGYVDAYGYDNTIEFNQRPGHSEHQLGLAIDFSDASLSGLLGANSAAAKWLAKNAWKYGWFLSYPHGDDPEHLWNETVCFRYEPWHYRYLGRDLAAEVHESGLTIREYLWTHFTMVDPTTGEPLPTPSPTPAETPRPAPTVRPTATLSAVVGGSPSPGPSSPAGVGTSGGNGPWLAIATLAGAGLALLLTSLGLAARRRSLRPRRVAGAVRLPPRRGGRRTTGR